MLDTCKKINEIKKIFVVHFEPLAERKNYLNSALGDFDLPIEYYISNSETDTLIKENLNDYYEYNESILNRHLSLGEIAVSVSHLKIYKKILDEDIDYCLILEDDAILVEDFYDKINLVMKEKSNYDFIFLSTCCNLHVDKKNENLLYETSTSRCVTGYIVNKSKLENLLSVSEKISTPIDAHLNFIKNKLDLKYAWCEPTLIVQGSETIYKSNLR